MNKASAIVLAASVIGFAMGVTVMMLAIFYGG
jgi:multisubunit Na+/H+ antiporter MnhC subunit